MKIAHFSLWAPNLSGLHEYCMDMCRQEKKAGLDPYLFISDIENPDPKRHREDGIVAQPWSKAKDCDVWVLHRSIPAKLMPQLPKKKNLAVLHGTSEILVLHDIESSGKARKFDMHVEFMKSFKKIVTITKYDYQIMKHYGKNVEYIPDAIDMDKYNIKGYPYKYRYRPAIISTSNIRINKNPAPLFWAIPEIIEKIPTARLNVFGVNVASSNTWDNLVLKAPRISNALEHYEHKMSDLRGFLLGADISFNSNYNGIFSRDSMEAMALGCSVVAYTPEHTKYACYRHTPSIVDAICEAWEDLKSNPEKQIQMNVDYARETFCMAKSVQKFITLYNSL